MSGEDPTFALDVAERVADVLAHHGVRSALIGAAAMAVHGYTRATEDLDLGTVGASIETLRAVADELREAGFAVELREPDAADPLGGLLRVEVSASLQVDVVNFGNPFTGASRRVGLAALGGPSLQLSGRRLTVVGVVPLLLLKLAAGSRFDLRDAAEILSRHPEVDIPALRAQCATLRLDALLDRVLQDLAEDTPAERRR